MVPTQTQMIRRSSVPRLPPDGGALGRRDPRGMKKGRRAPDRRPSGPRTGIEPDRKPERLRTRLMPVEYGPARARPAVESPSKLRNPVPRPTSRSPVFSGAPATFPHRRNKNWEPREKGTEARRNALIYFQKYRTALTSDTEAEISTKVIGHRTMADRALHGSSDNLVFGRNRNRAFCESSLATEHPEVAREKV